MSVLVNQNLVDLRPTFSCINQTCLIDFISPVICCRRSSIYRYSNYNWYVAHKHRTYGIWRL